MYIIHKNYRSPRQDSISYVLYCYSLLDTSSHVKNIPYCQYLMAIKINNVIQIKWKTVTIRIKGYRKTLNP